MTTDLSGLPEIDGVTHRIVETNGIEMHVAEAGQPDPDKTPVILCHGFPELWYSWRHQLPFLADAGHHVVAPDQRGYGHTTRPEAIDDYDIVHLTDDLLGLLDDLGHEQAVFVGHDWGSMVVWQMALLHPERVKGVCGMSVPYSPRGDMSITKLLEMVMGDRFFYILYFQEPGVADADLGKDPREAMRRFLSAIGGENAQQGLTVDLPAATTTFWDWMPPVEQLPPWLSDADLDVFAGEFERTGFTGGINWYRNFHRNWELTPQLKGASITVPSAFVAGDKDPVLVMASPAGMDQNLSDFRGSTFVPGAGHWVQQEAPDAVNAALLAFLGGLS
jgi:pimeloyl-ACP methyl ester carboxylesterase